MARMVEAIPLAEPVAPVVRGISSTTAVRVVQLVLTTLLLLVREVVVQRGRMVSAKLGMLAQQRQAVAVVVGVAQMVGCRRPAVVRRIAMVVMVVMPVMERLVGSEEPAIPIMLSRVSMVQVAVAVGMVAPPMLCPVLLAGQSLFGVLTSAHLVVAVVAAQLVAPEQQATIVVVQVVAMAAAVAVVVFRGRTPMSVELAARAFWSSPTPQGHQDLPGLVPQPSQH